LVLATTALGAQEQKQPQAPRPLPTNVALALVLAVDDFGWRSAALLGAFSPCRFHRGYATAQACHKTKKKIGENRKIKSGAASH
jgi:hypothetical protein